MLYSITHKRFCFTRQRSVLFFIMLGMAIADGLHVFSQNDTRVYRGFRVSLYGFKMVEQTDKSLSVRCHAVNTGREPLHFSKTKPAPEVLLVELDTLALPAILLSRSDRLVKTFLREKIQLSPGQIQSNILLKISLEPEVAEIPDFSKNVEKPAAKKSEPTPPLHSGSATAAVQSDPTPTAETGRCMDLVFDTAFAIAQKGKSIVVKFRIRNAGDRTAELLGATKSPDDNLALNIYFISGNKITRGALLAETIFYRDKSLPPDGKLPPGGIFEGVIDVSTKNRTKFSPNVALEIDPFQTLTDCNKTNNTFSILLKL